MDTDNVEELIMEAEGRLDRGGEGRKSKATIIA